MKADNSEFKTFVLELSKSPKNQGDSVTMQNEKWWQVLINVGINVEIDILLPGNTIDPVDLFP